MDEEQRKPYDNLFEEISVATAAGVSGVTLILHNGSGKELNDFVIKSKAYAMVSKKYLLDHIDDLTTVNKDNFMKAVEDMKIQYAKMSEVGYNFRASDTMAVDGLFNLFQAELNPNKVLRTAYDSDLRDIMKASVDSIDGLPEEVRAAFLSNSGTFVHNSATPKDIHVQLIKKLGRDNFIASANAVNKVVDDIENWKKQWTFDDGKGTWVTQKGNAVLRQYKNQIADWKKLLDIQERKKNTSEYKLLKQIAPDANLTFGELLDIELGPESENRDMLRKIFAKDRLLTLNSRDIDKIAIPKTRLNAELKSRIPKDGINASFTLLDLIKTVHNGLSDEDKKTFRQLEFINLFKGQNGEIYTLDEVKGIGGAIMDVMANLFPFSMARTGDIRAQRFADTSVMIFKAGELNPILAHYTGSKDYLQETVIKIYNSFYKLDENNNFVEIKELKGSKVNSTKTGMVKEVLQSGLDAIARKPDDQKNYIEKKLNLEFELVTKLQEEAGNNSRLFASFTPEQINYMRGLESAAQNGDIEEYKDFLDLGNRAGKFKRFIDRTTYGFNRDTAKKLYNALPQDSESRRFLDYIVRLNDSPEDLTDIIDELAKVEKPDITYKAPGLAASIRRYVNDPDSTRQLFSSTLKDPYARQNGHYISLNFSDELQRQLSEEFLSRYEDEVGYSGVTNLLENNLGGKQRREAVGLASTQKYLRILGFPYEKEINDEVEETLNIQKIINKLENFTNDNSEEAELIKNQVKWHINNSADFYRDFLKQEARDQVMQNLPDYVVLKPAVKVKEESLNIISSINQGHIDKAAEQTKDLGKRFVKQFLAGPGDPENFTELSIASNFIFNRVNSELDISIRPWFFKKSLFNLDLRLKGEDARTTKDLLKGFAIKRIGAAYGIYKGIDFLDDMTKAATGKGLIETGVSGVANTYLSIKSFTGAVGLDEGLKSLSSDNALLNYFGEFTGEPDGKWNTYDEQLDYYKNGYTPIRKARFWTFGSSNEFRGGRISYFEPNMLRSLASDYKDMSLYNGSYWEKWNPLNLLDPYHLERLHSEDRPYPVSGSLFEENTPWGVILNPTVGEMLKPKILLHRDRLQDGVDVKALIYQMNKSIKDKAAENNNLFYVQNGKLRSMDFMAYNAPEYSSRILTLNESDQTGYANDYERYNTPVAINDNLYQEIIKNSQKFIEQNKKLTVEDKIAIESAQGNQAAKLINTFTSGASSLNIIREENQKILAKAGYDKSQGIMVENKLSASVDPVDEILDNSEEITELMQAGSVNDYVHEMAVSARMITGLYGWGIAGALDAGQNNQDRIATAADMYSNSRAFWDMNLGGAGGSFMEIGRRFIPEYRRFQTKNPLMNTMPDWLPDRLKFGDAFTEIPNGEARLPGIGYESLNKLHPDIYGSYGAYDRFKILADVAPYSPEYKFWKNVAGKTVTDPYLRKDMDRIKERVKLQSKQHDFQEYKYVDREVDRRNAYITEIGKNGTFKIYGSDETYKLAGAKINANQYESQEEVLARYLKPGQLVSIMIDTNDAYARNNDKNKSINAAILIDGENVSAQMIKNGDADKRQSDVSAAAYMANHGDTVNMINWLTEKFMHADMPIFHNRWFRANSALEDYQDEYLYGTSFQSWDDFWQTFILPNARKEAASTFWTGTAIAADILRNNLIDDTKNNFIGGLFERYARRDGPLGKYEKINSLVTNNEVQRVIRQSSYLLDRGGLAGYLIGKTVKLGRSEAATLSNIVFRRAGSAANLAFSAIAAPENVGVSVMSWSRLAYLASNEFFSGKMRGTAAAAGAVIGLARWAGSKHLLSDDPYDTQYIPDSVKKRWEMQDYFDRLTYLKYMALYEKVADKAKSKEDTDIRAILEKQDEEIKNIKETKLEISDALDKLAGVNTSDAVQMRELLAGRAKELTPSKVPLSGGEYTKSAIMYYNAAKSTMYALNETSSMADVIRALPKTDREYFMEFLKEKDENKRQEILSYVSPQIRKALNMFWYKKYDEPESNESFFTRHSLPGPMWAGWNPNIDLADVQAKVIKNEGMNYSDFGVYASQYREPEVINAPSLDYSANDSLIESEMKIKTLLSGIGLTGVEVSVDKSNNDTIQVLANVARVTEYKLGETISNILEGI